MEGLLHPVGPEEARTYWIRRGAALLIVVVLVFGVGSMIANIGSGGSPVVAEPSAREQEPASAPGGPGAPAPAEGVAEEEAVPLPSSAETAPPRGGPGPAQSEQEGAESHPAPEPAPVEPAQPAPEAPAAEEPIEPEPANTFHQTASLSEPGSGRQGPRAVTACDARALRVSAAGPDAVRKGEPVMYGIEVANTSDQDCTVLVNEHTFELKVHSGNDRIWSSRDCVAGMPPRGAVLAPGRSLEWHMEWRADRSMPECQTDPEPMGSGTYVVTAQLAEAVPSQLVLQFSA